MKKVYIMGSNLWPMVRQVGTSRHFFPLQDKMLGRLSRHGKLNSTAFKVASVLPVSRTMRISVPNRCSPLPRGIISRCARLDCSAELKQDAKAKEENAGAIRGSHWRVHKFGGTCMAMADRIRDVAKLVISDPADSKLVVVSAMGSHPTSPIKVTDLILNMIKRASEQDNAFLIDLAKLQEKHVDAATKLLGPSSEELNSFIASLLDDIANLKAMLQAMSIGGR